MTYQKLYNSCYTSTAQNIADELRHVHGYQTEAETEDVERVDDIDLKAMCGEI